MAALKALFLLIAFCAYAFAHTTGHRHGHRRLSEADREWIKKHNPHYFEPIDKQYDDNTKRMTEFRANIQGVVFSGVFTDYSVLQRQPFYASLYGTSDTGNTAITMTMTDTSTQKATKYTTTSMENGDWKITLSETYQNGGDYTFMVECDGCKAKSSDTISHVTFGDVFFCAGQSNMQLELHYSFSRNYTYANITKMGKYSNIRFFTSNEGNQVNETYVIPVNNANNGEYRWNLVNDTTIEILDAFSAACFYTAQMLTDNHDMSHINFGLIDTAVGGTLVEQWTKNFTIPNHCVANTTSCPGPLCGGLYNGMLMPWINMTVKTVLWYQGENNVGHNAAADYGGNILNNTGYACMEQLMIEQMRTNWSVTNGGHVVPFGLVTLAAGTSEGHQASMGSFRWNQMLNYGMLPNENAKKTFVIQAHDIGDPWYSGCKLCQDPAAPYTANNLLGNGTNWFMGPIHPRPKIFVGERMARVVSKFVYDNDEIYSGPVLAGCAIDDATKTLTVQFDQSMMYDEELFYQPFEAWYDDTLTVQYQNAFLLNGNSTAWFSIDDENVRVDVKNNSVVMDISGYYSNGKSTLTGIRYAWSDYPCCGNLNKANHPCPMNMCPFQTSKTRLPAVPFWAEIVDNKCKCFAPQICS